MLFHKRCLVADHQSVHHDDHFEIVEALYQEATLTLSDDERAAFEAAETQPKTSLEAATQTPTKQRTIIRSRKPTAPVTAIPIFTRISDLYEEAEVARILASDEPQDETVPDAENEIVPEAELGAPLDDDFSIPETFETLPDEPTQQAEIADEPAGLTDEDIALLSESHLQDETPPADDVTISTQIEPAIALDDVLDGLLPPEETSEETSEEAFKETSEEASDTTSSEAEALALLDASRPQADDELAQQLADVKSAVEHAQIAPQTPDADEEVSAEQTDDEQTSHEDAFASVTTGPALASFIGETVREVLDEELPHLVRGLVDEALGERQGRYGRSETPHIGLRTKPSRH